VEVTIKVDKSRQLTVEAYIPEIDLTVNARATTFDENISTSELKEQLEQEKERLNSIST